MPEVSVIITSYNHERFLPEAIESVLNQTFEDLELIIIDDASTDSSRQIIEEFKEKDNRIRTIYHDKNMGITRTYKDAIEATEGKFIGGLASDDAWINDKLEKQLKILKKDENLIVWSDGLIIDSKSRPTGEKFTQIYKSDDKSGYLFEKLLKNNFILSTSTIFKKDKLMEIKIDEHLKYLSDHKLYVDLSYKCKFYFIEEPLVKYRLHGNNTIKTDAKGWYNDYMSLNKYFFDNYGDSIPNKTKFEMIHTTSRALIDRAIKKDSKKYLFYVIIPMLYLNYLLIANYIFNNVSARHK